MIAAQRPRAAWMSSISSPSWLLWWASIRKPCSAADRTVALSVVGRAWPCRRSRVRARRAGSGSARAAAAPATRHRQGARSCGCSGCWSDISIGISHGAERSRRRTVLRGGQAVQNVGPQRAALGDRRVLEVAVRIVGQPDLLHDSARLVVGDRGERDHLVEVQIVERDRAARPAPLRARSRGPTTPSGSASRPRHRRGTTAPRDR